MQGQAPSVATVTLTGPAPAGGAVVSLSTSPIDIARVPNDVTVSSGATTATFNVDTATVPDPAVVVVSANHGGVTRTASLTVTPAALVARFTVNSPSAGPDRCAIVSSGGTVDCELTASTSSGVISQYLWTFNVVSRSRNKNTADGATTPDTDCDLFERASHSGSSFAMEIVLQVVGRDGVSRSEPVRRTVAVVHNNFCGF